MSDDIARTHSLERTSPKGTPFVGTCRLCGRTGLTPADVRRECDNQRGLTEEESIVEAILGSEDNSRG